MCDTDRLFDHIVVLLKDLNAKNWKASVVGEHKVVIERAEDDGSIKSPLSPAEKQGAPVIRSNKLRKDACPVRVKESSFMNNDERPRLKVSDSDLRFFLEAFFSIILSSLGFRQIFSRKNNNCCWNFRNFLIESNLRYNFVT